MRPLLRLRDDAAERPREPDRPRLKLALVGDEGVGKTGLLTRLVYNTFGEGRVPTIGVDFGACEVELDGTAWKLLIWDLAGQERFRKLTTSYCRHIAGVLVVYDITDKESFNNVRYWMKFAENAAAWDMGFMIVGNKCDLSAQRAVSYEEGQALADYFGVPFLEMSAKSAHNTLQVVEAFAHVAKRRMPSSATIDKRPMPSRLTCWFR